MKSSKSCLCFNGNFLLIVMLCLVCLASGVNGSPGCQSKEHEISLKCMKSKQGKTNQGPKIEATMETTKASTTSNYQLFKCVSCVFTTDDHTTYYNHVYEKHKCQGFVCDIGECLKYYTTTNGFNYHLRTHGVLKSFKCHFCGIGFAHQEVHDAHEKSHQENEKPLKCIFCDMRFCCNYEHDRHQGVCQCNPSIDIRCKICDKHFKGRQNLLHLRSFHSQKGNFMCESCHKLFSQEPELENHTKSRECLKHLCCTL